MTGDALWDRLVAEPSKVPWPETREYLEDVFSPEEVLIIYHAHRGGVDGPFDRKLLDVFQLEEKEWTQRTVELHLAFWLVSGNRSYLRSMKSCRNMQVDVANVAKWRLANLELRLGRDLAV